MADRAPISEIAPVPNPVVEIPAIGGPIRIGNALAGVFFLGPCALESRTHALEMAAAIVEITEKLGIRAIYKTSFDKANRTSMAAFRGLSLADATDIFADIRETAGLPILTDVHLPEHCAMVADAVDILQIPAFLCRQTDLLVAAARTGKPVKVKKGQFLAPWDMKHVIDKLLSAGARDVIVTERGASFGYNTLVTDFRALPIMAGFGAPVVFDVTHSVQQPGGMGTASGGQREFAPVLARAAAAVGCAGFFLETHQDPATAPSDGPNMIPLDRLEDVLSQIAAIDRLAKSLQTIAL